MWSSALDGRDGVPPIGVWVLRTKGLLGQLHLVLQRKREEVPGHGEHLLMWEAQRGIDQVGKPGGGEDLVETLAEVGQLLGGGGLSGLPHR